jgi:CRISPR-associated endonuclease/helicase Cas3
MERIAPGDLPTESQSAADLRFDSLPPLLAAHSPNDSGQWHSLADHLAGTAARASEFGDLFGSAEACRLVGQLHDIGKADPEWQRYLAAAAAGYKQATVDHKHAGAIVCHDWGFGTFAFVIAGHHGGIPNASELRSRIAGQATDGQRAAIEQVAAVGVTRPELRTLIPQQFTVKSAVDAIGKRRMEFWLRMVFSALIDADRLDTEEHFRPGFRVAAQPNELSDLDARCGERRGIAVAERQRDPVAQARTEVFDEVMSKAAESPGWFELTAPTGSARPSPHFRSPCATQSLTVVVAS